MSEFQKKPELSKERAIRIGSEVILHFIDDPESADNFDGPFTIIPSKNTTGFTPGVDAISTEAPTYALIANAQPGDIVGQPPNRIRIISVKHPSESS